MLWLVPAAALVLAAFAAFEWRARRLRPCRRCGRRRAGPSGYCPDCAGPL